METRTVGELASGWPNATKVFEQFGIDYCCGGQKTLIEACTAAGLAVTDVISALQTQEATPDANAINWQSRSAAELTNYILDRYHAELKTELPALKQLSEKVLAVHGGNHPELAELCELYLALKDELEPHMMKEERILFPAIFAMDDELGFAGRNTDSCFGTIQNPIRVMLMEHDSAGEVLRRMREVTKNYSLPQDACTSYRTLFSRLAALEKDLHEHIHLENNILFPRAIQLEAR